MLQLLHIEWLKIRKYKTFHVLTALFTILLISLNYFVSKGSLTFGQNNLNLLSNAYSFPEVWDNIAFWTKFFTGLMAIMIIIFVTNEYQFRTHRQNVIDGWSRMNFFNAKWFLAIVMSLSVTLFSAILGLVFGFIKGGGDPMPHADKLLHVLLVTINYFGFALTLSLFIRKSGMTIIIFLLYTYVIELMLQKGINFKTSGSLGNYLPMQSSAELISFPLAKMAKGLLPGSDSSESKLVIVSCCWIVVYYISGYLRLTRSDW